MRKKGLRFDFVNEGVNSFKCNRVDEVKNRDEELNLGCEVVESGVQ